MNNVLRAGFAAALCLGAAACSHSAPPPVAAAPPPPPPPPAPAVVTAFDGVYRGEFVRTSESAKSCAKSHHATIRVDQGSFSAMPSKAQAFSGVQVGPDGSFTSTSGDSTLAGQFADGALSGKLDGTTCHYTVMMKQRPTAKHS